MHIGQKVHAIVDGIAYSGNVTSINKESVPPSCTYETPDGISRTGVKGEVHKTNNGTTALNSLFQKPASKPFPVGSFVASKTDGVISQVINTDISGGFSTNLGSFENADGFWLVGTYQEPYVSSSYNDSEDDGDDDYDDDDEETNDEDEEDEDEETNDEDEEDEE